MRRGEPWAAAGDRRFGRRKTEDERIWEDSWARAERKGVGRIFASRAARPTPERAESFTVLSVSEAWAKSYDFFFKLKPYDWSTG